MVSENLWRVARSARCNSDRINPRFFLCAQKDVNVLVVDTEMYSNTGGQSSKATPIGASVVFSKGGKSQNKKQLGAIFMTYEHCYVASVCLSNQSQLIKALVEADRYDGPSIVIAYAPCIQQQVRPDGLNDMFAGKFIRGEAFFAFISCVHVSCPS